jgi:uncharacterized protein (TIGR03000 family)
MRAYLLSAVLAVVVGSLAARPLHAEPAGRAPASIEVALPADALLTIDGQATRSTSSYRRLVTPPLEAGRSFRYTLRAQVERSGRTITAEREVLVRAGQVTFVTLDPSGGEAASGTGRETRAFYDYTPETPGPSSPGPRRLVPLDGGYRAPRGDAGRQPTHWGTPPSDPFYHTSAW